MNLLKHLVPALLLLGLRTGLADGIPEDRIKSAFVLNFARFVEWPDSAVWPDGKLTLCVIGRNVLGGALQELDGRLAGSHKLRVMQYPEADSKAGNCQIVYIGISEQQRLDAIFRAFENSPTLTISDIRDFAENGGNIGLRLRDNNIVFEVNLASTRKAKLRLPSQLLNLAAVVYGK